ncbi:efflux RND transporter periplasmic adaptor subunit [Myxococcota bacterium]|nr:efflux RND transporter periplasmic adaptor subunit [Myxococcota bacterium]
MTTVLVQGAMAMVLLSCSAEGSSPATAAPSARKVIARATPVVVTPVGVANFSDQIEAIGTTRAQESVVITADVVERVQRVTFEDGELVDQGQVLAELTSKEESAQLAEAWANYSEALRQHQRAADLHARGSESRSRLDERVAARDTAHARLEELQARLSDHLIRAPFRGVLGLRAVSPGALLKPGDVITTLDDIDTIKLDFTVPESFLPVVVPGLTVEAQSIAYPNRKFHGVVRAVDSRIDPITRSLIIRAEIPNPDHALRPGMLLTVVLETHPRKSLAVPEQALVPRGEHQYVHTLDDDGAAHRLEVTIGSRRPGLVEIRSGLTGTEIVISEGADLLHPGSRAKVVRSDPAPDA